MSQVTINNVKFTNIPNKKFGIKISNTITQPNISQKVIDYLQSEDFYKLVNAIDIDWNGIEIDENTVLNDTSDLINWIASRTGQNGVTPHIGANNHWFIGDTDTGVSATSSMNVEGVGNMLWIK